MKFRGIRKLRDKSDRATVEKALDKNTKLILFKLINKGFFDEIHGSISTGKEANVYYATKGKDEFAVKTYMTSKLEFRKRKIYCIGEHRFRKITFSKNPRKMIKLWAEKEMRNLMRMVQCGIDCPEPLFLKNNVLVMKFIGENGKAAKTLKNVDLSEDQARELYLDCVIMMRRMYNECKLIHADLSEFNMLLFKKKLHIIDVSQSVEHDHPNAFEFLRSDCNNVNEFFRKNHVQTMTLKELFEFITDPNINESNISLCLDKLQTIASQRSLVELTAQEKIEEEVFKQTYIPQRLDEVIYFERDFKKANDDKKNLYYQSTTGMKHDLTGPSKLPIILQSDIDEDYENSTDLDESNESDEESEYEDASENIDLKDKIKKVTFKDESSESSEDNEDSEGSESDNSSDDEETDANTGKPVHLKRDRNETAEEKRLRKKEFKGEKAEKRKTKIPKYIKKRNEKKKHRNTKQ